MFLLSPLTSLIIMHIYIICDKSCCWILWKLSTKFVSFFTKFKFCYFLFKNNVNICVYIIWNLFGHWSFPSVGHFKKENSDPVFNSYSYCPTEGKLHFYVYIGKEKKKCYETQASMVLYMVSHVCSFRINWHLLYMIMLIFSILIFLPYCIVEMYGTANISQGWV